MISKRSLKFAKGKHAVMAIASQKAIVVPKRSRMATARKFDATVIANRTVIASRKLDVKVNRRHVMASVVPMVVLANDLPKAIVLRRVIVAQTAIVLRRHKVKVVEARCRGFLSCSTRIKMAGSASMNSIG